MTQADWYVWDIIVKFVGITIATVGGIAGAIRYFGDQERNRAEQREGRNVRLEQVAAQKAQFLFELSQHFDNNTRIQEGLKLIGLGAGGAGGAGDSALERILGPAKNLTDDEINARFAIDGYLDFFDRLHTYTVRLGALKPEDIMCFAWYIEYVRDKAPLKAFAEAHGYGGVLDLADAIEKVRAKTTPAASVPH